LVEDDIIAALSVLFNGKVYHVRVPQEYPIPFCVFQQAGGRPSNTLCGNTDKQNARIKFTVWADNSALAVQLLRQAEAIVTSAPLNAVSLGSAVSMDDPATRRKGATQDLSFWGVFV
jgi:hypothetical protein